MSVQLYTQIHGEFEELKEKNISLEVSGRLPEIAVISMAIILQTTQRSLKDELSVAHRDVEHMEALIRTQLAQEEEFKK